MGADLVSRAMVGLGCAMIVGGPVLVAAVSCTAARSLTPSAVSVQPLATPAPPHAPAPLQGSIQSPRAIIP